MALDWPAFGDALWRVSDELGIRPEWVLPVISLETAKTFDPAITNPGGCVGLNQLCPGTYGHYVSVPVDQYKTWSASRQLSGPVFDYWRDAEAGFGPIRSAVKLMLSQLGHGLLRTAPTLDSVVFASPSKEYTANKGFDTGEKGYISVKDLANALIHHARTPAVQDAIARAYAMRPGEQPSDPVYGTDFGTGFVPAVVTPPSAEPQHKTGLLVVVLGALSVAAGYGIHRLRARERFTYEDRIRQITVEGRRR